MKLVARFALAAFAFYALPAFAAPQTYQFDPAHTNVYWQVNHLGFSNPGGKFANVTGTLVLDEAAPADSKVNVTIDIKSLNTGIPKLDTHMWSPDFFNVEKFPTATFVSDKVDVTGKDTAKVHGTLTLLGVSQPVVLDTHLNKIGTHPMTNKPAVGFSAHTVIKRSDFGMKFGIPNVGDEVPLDIEAEAGQ